MVRLQTILALLAPFALIALFHHMRFTTVSMSRERIITRSPKGARRKLPASAQDLGKLTMLMEASAGSAGAAAGLGLGSSLMAEASLAVAASEVRDDALKELAADGAAHEPPDGAAAASSSAAAAAGDGAAAADSMAAAMAAAAAATATTAAGARDVSVDYPPPTLSSKRLLDTSENWLPVPDAEGDQPSDLAWRRAIPAACKPKSSVPGQPFNATPPDSHAAKPKLGVTLPAGCVCPPGRRPYHTILTAQASTYQRWQTLIFYHHFRKAQRMNPCTEMTGFTRLLASSNGGPDDLMDYMPTVTVSQLGFDKTRGFQVINRPWTMLQFLGMPEWKHRIVEDYVYIAETDHLLLGDIPNRATPKLNVAFFFPYMSPVPDEQASVVKRYYTGNHLSVQPVGPSPAIVHVDALKKLTPLWYELSVDLKHDGAADRAFGWVLEMWGYSIACARVGIKHYVWQQLQIEPSSTWHQNVSAEDPYIYHYTFGVEYSADGIPMVGTVGEWSLDKRHYFGAPPPRNLDAPPECAQECAYVWWRMFNEATRALGSWWPANTGGNLRSFNGRTASTAGDQTDIGRSIVRVGPWAIDGQHKPIMFHSGGRVSSPWGGGKWSVKGEASVELSLCGSSPTLKFDSATAPTSFAIEGSRLRASLGKKGAIDARFVGESAQSRMWRAEDASTHTGVRRLLGTGPWAWSGISTMAFLDRGVLVTPWGQGTWHADRANDEGVVLVFAGANHKVQTHACHKFTSIRESDGQKVEGWVQLGQPARGCPFGGGGLLW
jgi:hypothetical protein